MRLTVTEDTLKLLLRVSLRGSIETSALASATSLAAPNEVASDKELAIEASGKGPFGASPTMSIIGKPSPSITQANNTRSSKQIRSSEGEIMRAEVSAVSK
jgi:hypothetical protein